MNNRKPQNTVEMNTGPLPYSITSQVGLINFGGFDLTECNELFIKDYDYDNIGEINLEAVPYPFIDGGVILSYLTERKVINFIMVIVQDTVEKLNIKIDEIKKRLVKMKNTLDIVVNGERRTTIASLTDLNFNREISKGKIQLNVDIQFTTYSPHFWRKEPVRETTTELYSNTLEVAPYNNGTATSDYDIYVTFTTGNTNIVGFELVKSGFVVFCSVAISDGDVLYISSKDFSVKLNSLEIDYDGELTNLVLGNNPIKITFIGDTFSYFATTKFLQQYT